MRKARQRSRVPGPCFEAIAQVNQNLWGTCSMSDTLLARQLSAFMRWKLRQRKTLGQLEPWLKQQGLYTAEAHRAIERAHTALHGDSITVAVAGEFSRGKTELINALFFSDFGRRLLPTDAGRTTMCPTEIFQDGDEQPYLRLLPIETRLQDASLHKLRQQPDAWIHHPLRLNNPGVLEQQLREITASRQVPVSEAVRLGLYRAEYAEQALDEDQLVEIPKWRLAQINFHHPLLAQGLRILDTPGLNAVGNEPELTYEMLPAAQAVLFVLGADTGVTRSDLEMWQQFIKRPGNQRRRGLMVVLNKTDTLWDELRPAHEVENSIHSQCVDVARILDIGQNQIFAASAQKALLARIRNDQDLEQRSAIGAVETHMSDVMVNNRRDLIMSEYTEHVSGALETLENIVNARHKRSMRQLASLEELSGQSESAVAQMLRETQRDKQRYQASVDAYRDSRNGFKTQGQTLMDALNLNTLDAVIERAHQQMSGAWTTHGLKEAMRILFSDINKRMETVSHQTQAMRRSVRTIYRRFQTDHDFALAQPAMFSIVKYQVELGLLAQEAEVFRNSPRTVMTEQHFVVRRYFKTIVSRVKRVFRSAREDAYQWLGNALDPLTLEVKEHRGAISQQIKDLKHAGQSRNTIQHRIRALQREMQRLQGQLSSLRNVRNALRNQQLPDEKGQVRPKLVAQSQQAT